MKKAALVAAALAMVLSLAACGNKDNNTVNHPAGDNGTTQNGSAGTNNDANANANGSSAADNNGSSTGSGMGTGSNAGTGTSTGTGTGTGTAAGNNAGIGNGTGTGTNAGTTAGTGTGTAGGVNNNAAASRSTVGNDLRRAADDVGDAVTGMVENGRSAVARGTSTTSFQRMLDNARVHDVDGVLTDGENSRW